MRIVHPSMTKRDVARSVATATLVDHPLRFVRYETISLAGPRAVTYRLPRRHASVVVRHGSEDIVRVLNAFGRGLYRLPDELLASLGERTPRIVDLGAGPGVTSLSLLIQLPEAQVVSVEPDPINAIILRRTMAANPRFADWTEVIAAVGDGRYLGGPGYGRLGPRVCDQDRSRRADRVDALDLLGDADLAVINIQGGEWRIMDDERFAVVAPPALILEPHARDAPPGDPAESAARRLTELDYRVITRRKRPGGTPILLAWRASAGGQDRRRAER